MLPLALNHYPIDTLSPIPTMNGLFHGENKAEGGIGWAHDALQIGETSVPHDPFPDATSSAEQKWNLEAAVLLKGRELQEGHCRVPPRGRRGGGSGQAKC